MTDYSKLVEALRYCAESGDFKCGKDCPMHTEYPNCLTKMDTDAADAIEELQAEQKKTVTQIFCEEQMAWEGRCKDLMKYISDLQAEIRESMQKCAECGDEQEQKVKELAKRNAELHAELQKWVSAAEQAGEPKRGEIVRCGECKYHLPETERTNPYCNRFHCMKPDDWFCADGEREVQE